jgi:type IV pilus assembly protein PilP
MLVACGADQDSDLHQFIETVSKRPGRTVEPIPDFKKTASFKYPNKLKRRDPFSAKGKRQAKDMSAPDLNRKKQPLEEFPIDGLSFVGTLSRGVHHWALIRTPKEQVFKVTIGQYMGQNYGRVVKITPKTLTLVESIRVNGRWQKKNIELKLK